MPKQAKSQNKTHAQAQTLARKQTPQQDEARALLPLCKSETDVDSVFASLPEIHQRLLQYYLREDKNVNSAQALAMWRENKVNCVACELSCQTRSSKGNLTSANPAMTSLTIKRPTGPSLTSVVNETEGEQWPYSHQVKCCTFQPAWANFMVGHWLFHNGGQLPVHENVRILPIGIVPTNDYTRRYNGSFSQGARAQAARGMKCSHLQISDDDQGGRCGIWFARPASCATFFCQSSFGAEGKNRLTELEAILSMIEMNLAISCLLEFGLTGQELKLNLNSWPGNDEAVLLGQNDELLWFEFQNQKSDFYLKCFHFISSLSDQELIDRLGTETWSMYQQFSRNLNSTLNLAMNPT